MNPPHFLGVVLDLGGVANTDADLGVGNDTIGRESPRDMVDLGIVVALVVVGKFRGGNSNGVNGDVVGIDGEDGLGNGDIFLDLDSADNDLGEAGGVANDNFGTFSTADADAAADDAVLRTRGEMVTKGGV